jgi:hypothetical protein
MDGTEIADQIEKAELYEAVKQALIRLLDDPQVQQKIAEILMKRGRQKPSMIPNNSTSVQFLITGATDEPNRIAAGTCPEAL